MRFPAHFLISARSFFLLALGAGVLAGTSHADYLSVGDTLPKTVLTTAAGRRIDLGAYAKDQKKRNLFLIFFRTGTCGICLHQLQELSQHTDEMSKFNAAPIAISLDDAIVQTRVKGAIEDKFPILLDPDAKTVKAFGIFNPEDKLARPSLYLIGPDRKVLYRYVGQAISDRPPMTQVMEMLEHYSGLLPQGHRSVSAGGTQ